MGWLCLALLPACRQDRDASYFEGTARGSVYRVSLSPRVSDGDAERLKKGSEQALSEADSALSGSDAASMDAFNRSKTTDWFEISPEIIALLNLGRQVYERSKGCFDLSIAPITELWADSGREHYEPSQEDIDRTLAQVGMFRLDIDTRNNRIRKLTPELRLDLSPLAPAYRLSSIAAFLEREGIRNYWIKWGNVIQVKGERAKGKAWRMAIDANKPTKPFPLSEVELLKQRELAGVSLATFGDYHRFSRPDLDHPVFNPKTGRPVSIGLRYVAVLEDNPLWAAAWNSALLCLGDEAPKVAEKENLGVLLVYQEGFDFHQYRSKAFLTGAKPALRQPGPPDNHLL